MSLGPHSCTPVVVLASESDAGSTGFLIKGHFDTGMDQSDG
jgi:hypothetical protein